MTPLPALLARIGWTQAELARRVGKSPETVGQWMRATLTRHGTPVRTPPDVLAWLHKVAERVESEPWRS